MARKNLLKGLMDEALNSPKDAEQADTARVNPSRPRYSKGAIGAVSQSIADLKSRAVVDIDPFAIEAGGLMDRLESVDEDDQALLESMRAYGQQVPVLVRPHPDPDKPDKYQIVYGRRRVLAMRDLGEPVKALVRDLDDRDLVVAQGQENTARKDLSFIEKTNFARQMVDAGYERKIICDTLHMDKTVLSRMLQIADGVPTPMIEAIGAAPSVGRLRWLELAKLLAETEADFDDLITMISIYADSHTSDDRFEGAMRALRSAAERRGKGPKPKPKVKPQEITADNGATLARVKRSGRAITLSLTRTKGGGFEDWLVDHLSEIHRDWKNQTGE